MSVGGLLHSSLQQFELSWALSYCQINWISLAVVGGCTALFMIGAILAYDPSRGFLARRGEPGGGA
jgi:hypothetical protein